MFAFGGVAWWRGLTGDSNLHCMGCNGVRQTETETERQETIHPPHDPATNTSERSMMRGVEVMGEGLEVQEYSQHSSNLD